MEHDIADQPAMPATLPAAKGAEPQSLATEPASEAAPITGHNKNHSLLNGARLDRKFEQAVTGSVGLTSNFSKTSVEKLLTAVVPAVAKAVLRKFIPRMR